MNREQLLNRVPPCGLMCYTCPGSKHGAIREHAAALHHLYQGMDAFMKARLSAEQMHILEDHSKFMARLQRASSPQCDGCRNNEGNSPSCIEGCFIPVCSKAHQVDFCGECGEFPCNRIAQTEVFDEGLKSTFVERGNLIKTHGAEQFFEMYKDKPHYMSDDDE